jgi:hypothetical protein
MGMIVEKIVAAVPIFTTLHAKFSTFIGPRHFKTAEIPVCGGINAQDR